MNLSYGRQWIDDEDIENVVKILKGDWLTMGPTVEAFEKKLADYVGVKHAVTFSSGTAALHGAMHAAGLKSGDIAITTALTFTATSNAVLFTGAEPVFGDIDLKTFCLDFSQAKKLSEKYKSRVKAIVPVSFCGYPFDIEPFKKLAKESGAVLIEDASHALGGERGTHKIGFDADMTTLSFHPVKHITTAEGGAVLTNNDDFAKKMRMFRNHGTTRNPEEFVDEPDGIWHSEMQDLGYNYRLSEMACALGLSQMNRLESFMKRRREIAEKYLEGLSGIDGLILPPHINGHAWHLFVVRVSEDLHREFFMYLRENGIKLQVHYRPVPLQPYYRKRFGYAAGDFPNSELYYKQAVSLPIFPLMSDNDVMGVIKCIKKFFIKED